MNQIEKLCQSLTEELSSMRCPDCGGFHHVEVAPLNGESVFSPSFPTLTVGPDAAAFACSRFLSKINERVIEARTDLIRRNGLL